MATSTSVASTTAGSTTGGSASGTGTTGGVGVGTQCQPSSAPGLLPDTACSDAGYYCEVVALPDGGRGGQCEYPVELTPCSAAIGCARTDGGKALVCTPGFSSGGMPISACAYDCNTTSDCPTLWTICYAHRWCVINYCTDSVEFVACDSAGHGDGACCPSANSLATCAAGGNSPADGPCTPYRTSSDSSVCPRGATCQIGSDGGSACYRMITFGGGGCYFAPADSPPPPAFIGTPGWGICHRNCDGGVGSCPAGQMCLPTDAGAQMACFLP
jgi:hypothetical protein